MSQQSFRPVQFWIAFALAPLCAFVLYWLLLALQFWTGPVLILLAAKFVFAAWVATRYGAIFWIILGAFPLFIVTKRFGATTHVLCFAAVLASLLAPLICFLFFLLWRSDPWGEALQLSVVIWVYGEIPYAIVCGYLLGAFYRVMDGISVPFRRPEFIDPKFLAAFDALPLGKTKGTAFGRPYVAVKSELSGGASQKLAAEELGGKDFISFNLYRPGKRVLLRPCKMPAEKVIDFVLAFRPEA